MPGEGACSYLGYHLEGQWCVGMYYLNLLMCPNTLALELRWDLEKVLPKLNIMVSLGNRWQESCHTPVMSGARGTAGWLSLRKPKLWGDPLQRGITWAKSVCHAAPLLYVAFGCLHNFSVRLCLLLRGIVGLNAWSPRQLSTYPLWVWFGSTDQAFAWRDAYEVTLDLVSVPGTISRDVSFRFILVRSIGDW